MSNHPLDCIYAFHRRLANGELGEPLETPCPCELCATEPGWWTRPSVIVRLEVRVAPDEATVANVSRVLSKALDGVPGVRMVDPRFINPPTSDGEDRP